MLARIWQLILRTKARLLFGRKIHVFGNFTVLVPKNVRIGENCSINHGVFILGRTGVVIGDNVSLSARCMLMDAGLDITNFRHAATKEHVERPIIIKSGSWIGAGAIVLSGVTIGERCIIGAGSVVTKDIPDFSIAVGNPAKVVRQLPE